MLSTDFVSVYPRSAEFRPDADDPYAAQLKTATEWSNSFGEVLYDRCEYPDGPVIPFTDEFMNGYAAYSRRDLIQAFTAINGDKSDAAFMAYNRLNFHRLNLGMLSMWMAISDQSTIGSRELFESIPVLQDGLALAGLCQYAARHRESGIQADYAYFAPENRESRNCLEGMGNEIDAAIVLLEVARRYRNLVIVPGPNQFEHVNNRNGKDPRGGKNRNADFIAFSDDGRAVGIQIKSQVTEAERAKFDPKRIVLVDARVDMGNQKVVRIEKGSSRTAVVTWSGVIAAQRVLGFSAHGQRGKQLQAAGLNVRTIMQQQAIARQLVSGMTPKTYNAAKIIGDRIMENL